MTEECPRRPVQCRAGYSDRQSPIGESVLTEIRESGSPDAPEGLMRCSYCGCVYQRKGWVVVWGWWGGMDGEGWHPSPRG